MSITWREGSTSVATRFEQWCRHCGRLPDDWAWECFRASSEFADAGAPPV